MHDVELFRLIPFKARCQLARACRRKQCSRNQVVCEQSDDAAGLCTSLIQFTRSLQARLVSVAEKVFVVPQHNLGPIQ